MAKILVWFFAMCLIVVNTLIVDSLGCGIDTWQWWVVMVCSNVLHICGRAMETED